MPSNQEQSTAAATSDKSADANIAAATPAQNTSVGKLLSSIEKDVATPFVWIGKEVNQIGKLFNKEAPIVQQDIKDASGILQIIKTDAAAGGQVLSYLIKKAYPDFSEDKLQSLLSVGITNLGLAGTLIGTDLITTLDNVAKHAVTLTGNAHNNFWNGLCNLVVAELQPSLPWAKVVTLVEWVYNTFIKPKA